MEYFLKCSITKAWNTNKIIRTIIKYLLNRLINSRSCNYRTLKVLSFYPTHKLIYHSFMDCGRRHETSRWDTKYFITCGSDTKNFITCGTASSMSFICIIVPLVPWILWDQYWGRSRWLLHYIMSVSHLKNPKMREIQLFIMDCKQSFQAFSLEKDITFIILGTKRTLSPLQVYMIK